MMTDGVKECGTTAMTNGKQGYLIVKLYKAFNNNLATSGTTALLSNLPGIIGIGRSLADTLPVT